MAFDLTKAAGFDRLVSKLDTKEITQIPLGKLEPSEKNFFRVDDVQDLMESIQVAGLLEPLLVTPFEDRFRIISGHRRHNALTELAKSDKQFSKAPCIVLKDLSADMEQVALIQANTTARELTHYEKAEAAIRMKKHLVELKNQGVKLPGRLREIVAEQMQISASEIARMEVIEKSLSEDWKQIWKANQINASCAYELARLPDNDQAALFNMQRPVETAKMTTDVIKEYILHQKCLEWERKDCPFPLGWSDTEDKRQGKPVPCRNLPNILKHKEQGHPEKCCGCCGECEKVASCKEACYTAASHARMKLHAEEQQEKKAQQEAAEQESIQKAKEAFSSSVLSGIGFRLASVLDANGLDPDDAAELWTDRLADLIGTDDFDDCEGSELDGIISASRATDLGFSIPEFVALCQAIGTTPNHLLGFDDQSEKAAWHNFVHETPANGQRVVIMQQESQIRIYKEYAYRDGNWYFPEIPDCMANVHNVIAWTEPPADEHDSIYR